MASAFFRGHGKGRMHTSVYLQPAEFSKNTHLSSTRRILNQLDKKVCAHQIQFWFYKKQDIRNNPLWASWLLKDVLLHTRDACCTLCCGRTAKPLFHEVETVGLWVWFPSMICLGWWAGTTGPPRTPTNQGCEHLSVMPLLRIMLGLSLYFLFLNTEILSFSFCRQFTSKDSFKSATVRPKEMLVVLFWYFIAQSQSNGVQRNWWIASREMLKNQK